MFTRVLASRGFVTMAGLLLTGVLAVAAYFVAFQPTKKMLSYCADMPDAIGLYAGNHVTMRGMTVGTVTALEPTGGRVRVEFEIDADHPLYGPTSATTVADTVVADRNLAVLDDPTATIPHRGEDCITQTFTPKSITETLTAFFDVASHLGSGTEARDQPIRAGVDALNKAVAGTGPRLNELIDSLGSAMRAPDAAIGHLGELLDAVGSLAGSIQANWGDIKTMLVQFAPGLTLINNVWDQVVQLIDSLLVLLPWLNRLTVKYGGALLNGLDATIPYIRWIGANVGSLQQLVNMVPVIVGAFSQAIDPVTGRVRVDYATPRVQLPQPDSAAVCAAINAVMPDRCRTAANGLADIDAAALVLGLGGAR